MHSCLSLTHTTLLSVCCFICWMYSHICMHALMPCLCCTLRDCRCYSSLTTMIATPRYECTSTSFVSHMRAWWCLSSLLSFFPSWINSWVWDLLSLSIPLDVIYDCKVRKHFVCLISMSKPFLCAWFLPSNRALFWSSNFQFLFGGPHKRWTLG